MELSWEKPEHLCDLAEVQKDTVQAVSDSLDAEWLPQSLDQTLKALSDGDMTAAPLRSETHLFNGVCHARMVSHCAEIKKCCVVWPTLTHPIEMKHPARHWILSGGKANIVCLSVGPTFSHPVRVRHTTDRARLKPDRRPDLCVRSWPKPIAVYLSCTEFVLLCP